MPFNTDSDKCEVITFSIGPSANSWYSLSNTPLECVEHRDAIKLEV